MTDPVPLLLIEDDTSLAGNLRQVLEDDGFAVTHCTLGDERLRLAGDPSFAVVLTWGLHPGGAGS
jgi:DNA-binding response OmpR family regulator